MPGWAAPLQREDICVAQSQSFETAGGMVKTVSLKMGFGRGFWEEW